MESTISSLQERKYEYFSFDIGREHLLPYEHELVVDLATGLVVLADWEQKCFVTHCSFSMQELPLLLALLQAWPQTVSYEQMMSVMTGIDIQILTRLIDWTRQQDALGDLFGPVRTVLMMLEKRVKLFNLKIVATSEGGYICALAHSKEEEV